jgi:hypothetical protein
MLLATTSGLAALLPLLFILVCPVAMILMMKGMHGGHGGHAQPDQKPREQMSMDQLKHERDVLNEEIGQRAEQIVYSGDSTRRGALR